MPMSKTALNAQKDAEWGNYRHVIREELHFIAQCQLYARQATLNVGVSGQGCLTASGYGQPTLLFCCN